MHLQPSIALTPPLHPSGWAGLSAAKTYLQVHPTASLLVLDAQESIGGTWAKSRIYPTLKSNNLYGINFQFPDFPMDSSYGIKEGEHIPGAVVNEVRIVV